MTKCEFNQLNNEDIDELKKYLNILLKNNLINENDKVQKVLSVIHPDKRIITSDISIADYDCATTVLNGYINYIKDNQISDNSVKYALNLQSTETINQEDTNQNFLNTFACLSNINPELLSEQIITRVKILSETVFGVKYDEEKSSVVDNSPLPISISNVYDEKQTNYNKLVSQYDSFQCYIQLLNEFEYLLCYAFLLKQYSLELREINKDNFGMTNQGGKKRKTIRKLYNKNKTKKFRGGGVKNIEQFSTFWSWITSKIGDLSGLSPDVIEKFNKNKTDIEYYSQNIENLEQKRNEFYKQVDEWNKTNEEIRQENIKIDNLSIIQQFLKKKKDLIDINIELLGDSVLENNLKQLWLTQKEKYNKINKLTQELETLESSSSEIILPDELNRIYNYCKDKQSCYNVLGYKIQLNKENDNCGESHYIYDEDTINNYNKKIDELLNGDKSNRIIVLKNKIGSIINECKNEENRVINNSQIRNKLFLFVNYIISVKFLGKDNIELFLNLCETKIKDTYLLKIEALAKEQAIIPIRVGFAEHSLQTPLKKETLESYLGQSKFSDNFTVTKEDYENEIMRQKSILLDNLTNQLVLYRETIKQKFEDLSETAETKLAEINNEYSNNQLFTNIRTNILKLVTSGTFLFLNSYGKNPFKKIASSEIGKSIISSNIYSFIVSSAIENPDTIIPTLDSYFLYIQLIIVIFITPNLLKSMFPTTFDNKAVNYLIVCIQFIILLAYIVMHYTGFDTSTDDTYFIYNSTFTAQSGSWLGNLGPILDINNLIFDYLPKTIGNNILLAPSYYLKNLIYTNGKSIIFLESLGLLGCSVTGLTSNFISLSKQQEILYKKAKVQLKDFVYSDIQFDEMEKKFIDLVKSKTNIKEQEDLIPQLTGVAEEVRERFKTSLQAMTTTAQVETAMATKEQTAIMRQQQQQQPQFRPLLDLS